MAVPARVYVGVLVFGVMTTLLVGGYTILILGGYTPEPSAPYEVLFPPDEETEASFKAFLVAASVCCVALTSWAWRSLVRAARRDAEIRRLMKEGKWPPPKPAAAAPSAQPSPPKPAARREEGPPPGYG